MPAVPTPSDLVSVVIPAYNRERTIARAIESVLGQTHARLEVLVVDDGSNDGTVRVAQGYAAADARVQVLGDGRNRGAQAARNEGIRAARGPWITFLDSDDEYLSDSVERRLAAAVRLGVEVVHSEGYLCAGAEAMRLFGVPPMEGRILGALLRSPGPLFPALLASKAALVAVGMLDAGIRSHQEWDTAIRLARRYSFAFVPEPTFIYYRGNSDAISAQGRPGVEGYQQVVDRHAPATLRLCGVRTLRRHYEFIVGRYAELGVVDGSAKAAFRLRLLRAVERIIGLPARLRGRLVRS